MKYGEGITLRYSLIGFYYQKGTQIVTTFCPSDLRIALGLRRNWYEKIKIIAHNRVAKKRAEVYIERVGMASTYAAIRRGRYWYGKWVSNRLFYDLGIEPEDDTYFWLEVKQ